MPKVQVLRPVVPEDPAGLDKLLLAAGKGLHDLARGVASSKGFTIPEFWGGENGLEAVLRQAIAERGIPNKRLPDLVNPRTLAENAGLIRKPKTKRRIAR